MWQSSAIFNGIILFCYLTISWNIFKGLIQTKQLTTNKLGLATGLIFFYCGIHHGLHTFHMLEGNLVGQATKQAMDLHTVAWDLLGSIGGVWYLSLRKMYKVILEKQPVLFLDDTKRKQQAEAINTNITEKLVAARLHSEAGEAELAEESIGEALEASREVQSLIAQGAL